MFNLKNDKINGGNSSKKDWGINRGISDFTNLFYLSIFLMDSKKYKTLNRVRFDE